MKVVETILQVLLALAFLGAGGSKLMGQQQQVDNFKRWGYPDWFRLFTGACEVLAAIGLLVGIAFGWVAFLAALWIVAIMIGALYTHVRVHDPPQAMIAPAVLLVLAAVVAVLRWPELANHL